MSNLYKVYQLAKHFQESVTNMIKTDKKGILELSVPSDLDMSIIHDNQNDKVFTNIMSQLTGHNTILRIIYPSDYSFDELGSQTIRYEVYDFGKINTEYMVLLDKHYHITEQPDSMLNEDQYLEFDKSKPYHYGKWDGLIVTSSGDKILLSTNENSLIKMVNIIGSESDSTFLITNCCLSDAEGGDGLSKLMNNLTNIKTVQSRHNNNPVMYGLGIDDFTYQNRRLITDNMIAVVKSDGSKRHVFEIPYNPTQDSEIGLDSCITMKLSEITIYEHGSEIDITKDNRFYMSTVS